MISETIIPTVTLIKRPTRGDWTRFVCRVLMGADQPGHKPRGRALSKGDAWDLCRREGAKHGIQDHWWRKDHSGGTCQWTAYKKTTSKPVSP